MVRKYVRKKVHRRKINRKRIHRKRGRGNPTRITYRAAGRLHQPISDRYFTVLSFDNQGAFAGGASSTNSWMMSLVDLSYPLNTVPAGGNKLPNPVVALNASNPVGLKNLLFNSSTNTGLWNNYRVWGVKISVTYIPLNIADAGILSVAPTNNNGLYGSLTTTQQAPGSKTKILDANTSGRANTISKYYSIPQLLGIPKKDYSVLSANQYGNFTSQPTSPVYLTFFYQQITDVNTTAAMGINISCKFYVEFFGRVDTALIDS